MDDIQRPLQEKDLKKSFSHGFPLWIVADLKHSKWAQKLDWYLNFQLRRASLHQSKKISESNQEKIASWGVEVSRMTKPMNNSNAALLIDSHHLLPNQITVQIAFQDAASWSKECVKITSELKHHSARIFLPSEMSGEQFTKAVRTEDFQFELIEESAID